MPRLISFKIDSTLLQPDNKKIDAMDCELKGVSFNKE